EALAIEQRQQGGEAVRVAVVRGGGQEQPVIEQRRELADHARGVGGDGVLAARGRRGGVGLVEDEQRAAPPLLEQLVQRLLVLGAAQRLVRDDEARVRDP